MKKLLATAVTVATILGASTVPAFANVIHANGSTGQPSAVGSNLGSAQGQAHRSSTGTTQKITNDGWKMIVT